MQRRGFLGIAAATLLVFSAGVVANVQGAPGGGQGGGRRGGGMGRGGGGGLQLLRIPEVQRELKMTPEQIAKIEPAQAALRQSLQGQGGGNPGQASREERQAMMARMRDAQTKAVNGILDATQQKRFRQLELQRQGANALTTRKDVADELKLTEVQQKDIVEVQRRAEEDMQSAMAGVDFRNMSPEERQAMGAKMQAAQKATDEKITALLTDAQKAQWKEMQGAPFTFPANARGGFGGGRRGGGGGAGGGGAGRTSL